MENNEFDLNGPSITKPSPNKEVLENEQLSNAAKVSDFPTYSQNPFKLEGIKTVSYVAKGNPVEHIDTETGEVLAFTEPGKLTSFDTDNLEFRKVFTSSFQAVMKLSPPGVKVLCYVMENLKVRDTQVLINMKECLAYTQYDTSVSVYKGIFDLLKHGFLVRKTGNSSVYFINPNMFFNGKRV